MTKVFFNPVTLVLSAACLQWIVLAETAGFSVQLPYLALAIAGLFAVLSLKRLRASLLYIRENAAWLAPLAIYLLMTLAIFANSPGGNIAPRQIFYMICGIGFAAWIVTASRLKTVFRVGAGLGLLVFVAAIEVQARTIGLSWTDALSEFFHGGNLEYVFYSFFTNIFNSIDPGGDNVVSASRKNDIAVSVLLLALLFRSGTVKAQRDVLGMAVMAGASALLIMLNDRSVLIAGAVCLLIATALGAAKNGARNAPLLSLKMIAVVAVLAIGIGMSLPESAVSNTLRQRFSFEDKSTSGRLEGFEEALGAIGQHPIAGNGYFEIDGLRIHNIFLAAWAYEGIIAFGLVVLAYFALLGRWVAFVGSIARRPDRWVLPLAVEWIAPLPFIPLFRTWLSGEGGVFKMGEWLAISAFCGCCVANRIKRRTQARMAQQHARSSAFAPVTAEAYATAVGPLINAVPNPAGVGDYGSRTVR